MTPDQQKELDALNEALAEVQDDLEIDPKFMTEFDDDLLRVCKAAQQYAALLKLAPEIGALVLELDTAHDYHIGVGRDGTYLEKKILSKRPTLRAIHDNLTKWGE